VLGPEPGQVVESVGNEQNLQSAPLASYVRFVSRSPSCARRS